mmetsp:Transcript_15630/g.49424  ORF Transcript_15630/g.49424 Transcript_15630/m.49424 type:complete len:201 (-) Transcript_15630:1222-1824(-)
MQHCETCRTMKLTGACRMGPSCAMPERQPLPASSARVRLPAQRPPRPRRAFAAHRARRCPSQHPGRWHAASTTPAPHRLCPASAPRQASWRLPQWAPWRAVAAPAPVGRGGALARPGHCAPGTGPRLLPARPPPPWPPAARTPLPLPARCAPTRSPVRAHARPRRPAGCPAPEAPRQRACLRPHRLSPAPRRPLPRPPPH